MTRRSKDIGTDAERAVARFLVTNGWPSAERRALHGSYDLGDITGTPGVVWEVKGGARAKVAADGLVALWREETRIERANAGADIGILVIQRAGYGPTRAGSWWAILDLGDFAGLLDTHLWGVEPQASVRVTLQTVCTMLRAAGYGEPLPIEAEL